MAMSDGFRAIAAGATGVPTPLAQNVYQDDRLRLTINPPPAAMSSSQSHWSESPFQLLAMPAKPSDIPDDFYKCAVDMALIHNIFIRALNSICLHAPKVARSTTRDKADFITFVLAWYESLHEHHEGEEKYYFTELEAVSAAGLMATNYAQHEAFHAGLAALHEYAKSVRATPDTFDAAHLLSIIDAFAPALTVHLHDEIPTLLELGRTHPHIDIRKIDETHAQRMVAGVNKFYFLPLFFSNHDRHFDGGKWQEGFPAVPHAVRVVTKWILYFPHRGAWRFSACTFDEELKPNMVL